MATFALIHGGGSTAWDWHLVTPLLRDAGHHTIAVDLPIEDEDAGLDDYVQAVVAAIGTAASPIVVGHSLGGFTAPLVCEALPVSGLVYLSAMIPLPGESFIDWWANTGHDRENIDDDLQASFFNGVPDPLIREARARERNQRGIWLSRPWPGNRHPSVPTMAILCREDGFFPPEFMRRQIHERLGIEPVEISGGHYSPLSNPQGVASALSDLARTLSSHP